MIKKTYLLIAMAAGLMLAGCSHDNSGHAPYHRGIYHWKTTYNPTAWELQWMKDHKVDRMYIKLFDIVDGDNNGHPGWKMVPVATTQFLQELPDDIEIVPVVYITVDAIRALQDEYYNDWHYYAGLITKRIDDMMSDLWSGTVHEVQLDCDWTEQTEDTYFSLVRMIKDMLHKHDITLSVTLRLHQLHEAEKLTSSQHDKDCAPFDRTLLMCYNTGRLQDPATANSILDLKNAEPYLRQYHSGSLPNCDVAYPVFGWGVEFDKDGVFQRIIGSHQLEAAKEQSDASHTIREEWGRPDHILRVKSKMPRLDDRHTIVLYHLDSLNLTKFSHEDIEKFYSR